MFHYWYATDRVKTKDIFIHSFPRRNKLEILKYSILRSRDSFSKNTLKYKKKINKKNCTFYSLIILNIHILTDTFSKRNIALYKLHSSFNTALTTVQSLVRKQHFKPLHTETRWPSYPTQTTRTTWLDRPCFRINHLTAGKNLFWVHN